jgi:hypothetical protein
MHKCHAYAVSVEIDHEDQIPPLSLNFGGNVKCLSSEIISYHRLRWLGKVCRMTGDRLPLSTLFGRIGGRVPRGLPTQNLDRVCAGGFSPVVRIAWGVWNIHELVVTV